MTSILRILIVDDDPRCLQSLTILLSAQGHCPHTVANPKDAIRLAEETPYDLVITDLSMPEMSGYEIASVLTKKRPTLPILLLTAFADLIDAVSLKKVVFLTSYGNLYKQSS